MRAVIGCPERLWSHYLPSLAILKTQLYRILGNLLWMTLLWAVGRTR